MLEDDELAYYQEMLLNSVFQNSDAEKARQILLDDPRLFEHHICIQNWELRMVELAAILTKKWGVADGGIGNHMLAPLTMPPPGPPNTD